MANIPTQASWPVIEVGSDGGVMRGCGVPFWETVEGWPTEVAAS